MFMYLVPIGKYEDQFEEYVLSEKEITQEQWYKWISEFLTEQEIPFKMRKNFEFPDAWYAEHYKDDCTVCIGRANQEGNIFFGIGNTLSEVGLDEGFIIWLVRKQYVISVLPYKTYKVFQLDDGTSSDDFVHDFFKTEEELLNERLNNE